MRLRRVNKKGEEALRSTLVKIITTVAVFTILIAVFISLSFRADESTKDTMCRASVLIKGKATISIVKNLWEAEKVTPLACSTTDLGELKGNREDVKRQIGDYSAKCWWQFAEGTVPDLFTVDKKDKACFVCYTFTIDKNLDLGAPSQTVLFDEPQPRAKENISGAELMNYLVSTNYNPGIIYGGGTKNYYGINYTFDISVPVEDPVREFKSSRIDYKLIRGHILDFSYKVNDETKEIINNAGVELQMNGHANLFVIVAEDFKGMDRSDARGIIEDAKLDSNETEFDALLVMVNLNDKMIRVHAGSDLSVYLAEYKMEDIMREGFTQNYDCEDEVCKFNKALGASIVGLKDKVIQGADNLPGINPKSYYYYLSNGGGAYMMVSDVLPQRRYAITYVGTSDDKSIWSTKVITYTGTALGVVAGAALTLTGVGAPLGVTIMVAAVGAGAAAGSAAGYGTATLFGVDDEKIRPNNILIVPVNSISDKCSVME